MWRRVGLVRTDVSEGSIASIFRVKKSASEAVGAKRYYYYTVFVMLRE
jgi:hypothetical protein